MFFRVVQSAWLIIPNIEVATVRILKEKGVLRNFAKITVNHLCQSLFFNTVAGLEYLFLQNNYGGCFCDTKKTWETKGVLRTLSNI